MRVKEKKCEVERIENLTFLGSHERERNKKYVNKRKKNETKCEEKKNRNENECEGNKKKFFLR